MREQVDAQELADNVVINAHTADIVCNNCGYDLDETELNADTCSDCGQPLQLKRSIAIQVTSVPAFGESS